MRSKHCQCFDTNTGVSRSIYNIFKPLSIKTFWILRIHGKSKYICDVNVKMRC
nr:MAG TPA: hypothetical protein [Caudoviricetes sp.]